MEESCKLIPTDYDSETEHIYCFQGDFETHVDIPGNCQLFHSKHLTRAASQIINSNSQTNSIVRNDTERVNLTGHR